MFGETFQSAGKMVPPPLIRPGGEMDFGGRK